MKQNTIVKSFSRLLQSPEQELTRWQYAARYLLTVFRHGLKQLREDRAGQMAAALAFRTLFGLVPLIAIGMVLFQAFGGAAIFEQLVRRLVEAANLTEIKLPNTDQSIVDFLLGLINNINQNVSFKSIGIVGLLLLGWAAIGLLTTIEKSFNTVCRAPSSRPLSRRVPLYWMGITLGPALIYVSFSVQSRFAELVESMVWGGGIMWVLGLIATFCTTWLLLMSLYLFMPNTRLPLRAVAIGSFVSALLWTVGQRLLVSYISTAFGGGNANFSVLYGSLGLIPVFMLWVYFMWIIVLFGLEVASTLQNIRGSLLDQRMVVDRPDLPSVVDPAVAIPVMRVIAKRFADGSSTDEAMIVEETHLHERTVSFLLDALHQDGLIHPVARLEDGGDETELHAWVLARPAETISAEEILRSAHRAVGNIVGGTISEDGKEEKGAGSLLAILREAQCKAAAAIRLSEL